MGKSNSSAFIENAKRKLSKHGPEILTGIGIAGMVTTTILAVKATPKALKLLEKAEREKHGKLTGTEKVKTCWRCYVPTAVTGVLSVSCLIGASSANGRRNAALATAYKLSETAFSEYKEKVVETIGEKKEQVVREKVAEEQVKKHPVEKSEVIITGKGDTLCLDSISGRYFKSNMDSINKAVNELNRRMIGDTYVSLNDFYYAIGLEDNGIGDDIGWSVDKGFIDINFSSQLAGDGTPCLVINYTVAPKYGYDSFL